MITIFAVSSIRSYSNGELYYGTDAVFLDTMQAEAYIRADMQDLIDSECADYESDELLIDYDNYTIDTPDNHFGWQLEPITLELTKGDTQKLCKMLAVE